MMLPGEEIGKIVNRPAANETTAITTGPSRADAERRLFVDLDRDTRAWVLARYTSHPIAALEDAMEPRGVREQRWAATVIRCRRATNPPESRRRRTAERLQAAWRGLDTGHYPMLSEPDALARLLLLGSSMATT